MSASLRQVGHDGWVQHCVVCLVLVFSLLPCVANSGRELCLQAFPAPLLVSSLHFFSGPSVQHLPVERDLTQQKRWKILTSATNR